MAQDTVNDYIPQHQAGTILYSKEWHWLIRINAVDTNTGRYSFHREGSYNYTNLVTDVSANYWAPEIDSYAWCTKIPKALLVIYGT